MLISPVAILRLALQQKAAIYQFHDPELIFVGLFLKVLGRYVVYDIHEIVAKQIETRKWIPFPLRAPVRGAFSALERFAIRRFDGISVPQTSMQEMYRSYAKRIALTRNFVTVDEIAEPAAHEKRPSLLYAGGMSRERGLLNMVRAMPHVRSGRRLILAGRIGANLLAEAKAEPGWAEVDYRGEVPFAEVEALYRAASIGLLLYENVGQYHLAHAVKLFEFLAHGMPVVMPNFGEWVTFNAQYDVGVNVDTSNPHAVGDAINGLIDDPDLAKRLGDNGRRLVFEEFSWEREARNLNDLYRDILKC
jgi:glycosyltransferase involved in cell wall biosynthesis